MTELTTKEFVKLPLVERAKIFLKHYVKKQPFSFTKFPIDLYDVTKYLDDKNYWVIVDDKKNKNYGDYKITKKGKKFLEQKLD